MPSRRPRPPDVPSRPSLIYGTISESGGPSVAPVRSVVLIGLTALALVGCGDDLLRPASAPDLTVRVATRGAAYDADGYVLSRDDGRPSIHLEPRDQRTISFLGETVTLELDDVASNCAVSDGTRRSVVRQEADVTVAFDVECAPPPELSSPAVVFVRRAEIGWGEAGDLHELSIGGSHFVALTSEGGKLAPSVTADGVRMAFTSFPADGSSCEIKVTTMDGSPVTSVPDCGRDPSWSPEGTRIAYAVGDGWFEARLRIWDLESEGSVDLPSGEFDEEPAWSPSGGWIAFTRWTAGDSGIHLLSPDGMDGFSLTTEGSSPVWSPTGRQIAYLTEADVRILTVADGSSVEFLTRRRSGEWEPTDWSADGEWIALTEWRNVRTEADVYVAHVPDGRLFRLTIDGLSHSAVFRDGE